MTKLFLSFALASFALATVPQALKAADPEPLCPRLNATLVGTYMSHGTGTVVGVGPVAAVGTITYDGEGKLVNPFTLSVNGSVARYSQTGTYTVKSDCTGTVVQAGAHYDFVVSPDASTVFWMETDPGTIITGTASRMKPTDAEQAQVHPSSGLPRPASRPTVTLQPANLRIKTPAVTRKTHRG
jgi:hypothetical protein